MSNHLMIGLGGTGGKVIRAFRKIIFQEFRDTDPTDVHIGYLYVDSDRRMMAPDDPDWKILGHRVQLGKNSQLCIEGADLQNRLDNVQNFPGLRDWLGDRQQWQDILRSFAGGTIFGGQKRRLGRFLFACNIERFGEQLHQQVTQLHRATNQADITFHIVCGLAGGTGSGSLLDVLTQIRKHYPYGDSNSGNRVLVYALLPEKQQTRWDTGNYHANGYAALMELNALSAGRLDPCDVSQGGPTRCMIPFNGLYLFSNQNEQGIIVDVDKDIPHIAADFLFQKIVAVRHIAWENLGRMENMENGDSTPETTAVEGSKVPERAKRFLTFGIKRVAIPEEEIREYLSYHFALQVGLHLLYNNWDDSKGFVRASKNDDYFQLVAQKATQARWLLSTEHLCLSLGILPADHNQWAPIDADWDAVAPRFKTLVRAGDDKAVWLDELRRLFAERWQRDFRSRNTGEQGGVLRFYDLKLRSRAQMAREIRQRVERDLFEDWKNGVRSIHELGSLMSALVTSLDERRQELEQRLVDCRDAEEGSQRQVDEVAQHWAHLGRLRRAMQAEQILDKQALYLRDLYTHRTWGEAFGFAKKLLDEVLSELRQLQTEIDHAINTASKAVDTFHAHLAQRLQDGHDDLSQQLIRFYDRTLVETVTRELISNEQIQKTCASEVRMEFIRRLGAEPDFTRFNALGFATFEDILVRQSEQNAIREHSRQSQQTQRRLLGVSIIEKLQERYAGDPQGLRLYVGSLVNHACHFLTFNQSEIQKAGAGIASTLTRQSLFTVVLPAAPQHAEFVEQLKKAFTESYTGEVEFLESDTRLHEIVLVNITNLFPLRFVEQTSFLRHKYTTRMDAGDTARSKIEVHIEGDGSQLPPLFVPSMEELRTAAEPYLLLAKSMHLIHELKNPQTGKRQLAFLQQDEYGFDLDPVYLGEKFVESAEKIDAIGLDRLQRKVHELLPTDYVHQDDKERLIATMQEEVKRVKVEECGDNLEDPRYKRILQAARVAVKLLQEEGAGYGATHR